MSKRAVCVAFVADKDGKLNLDTKNNRKVSKKDADMIKKDVVSDKRLGKRNRIRLRILKERKK